MKAMAPRWQAAKVPACSSCSTTSAGSSVVKAMAVQRTMPQARPRPIRPVTPMRFISQPLAIISRISTATLSPHSMLMVTSSIPAPRQVSVPKL